MNIKYPVNEAPVLNEKSLKIKVFFMILFFFFFSFYHSPPVREKSYQHHSTHSGNRRPFSTSFQTRSLLGETQHDADIYPPYDAQDLDRKIQTLDNLQQKLSFSRGTTIPCFISFVSYVQSDLFTFGVVS